MTNVKTTGKAFDRAVAVAVEGIDFFHLLRTQFDCVKVDKDFWIYDFCEGRADGGGSLNRWLHNFQKLALESQAFGPRTLAIIRDAEDDLSSQFSSVCSGLKQSGLPTPTENGGFAFGDWQGYANFRVGVLIIPPDAPSGCLESCLLRAPKVTHALEPAKDFQVNVEAAARGNEMEARKLDNKTQGGLARWREKVRVRSMIAANLDEPGQQLGPSGTWLWDFSVEPLKAMIDFIRQARVQI